MKSVPIVYPQGGYDFPKHIDEKDSNFICYPVKGLESPSDSIREAFYGRKFLEAFNEPNLSLRPNKTAIFRFMYEGPVEPAYVITLTDNEIIVKKGDRNNYLNRDETQLTEAESFNLQILEINFPLIQNNQKLNLSKRHFLDSLININPKLLDPLYFSYLLNKIFIPCKTPFTYTTTKISLSNEQFNKLLNLINSSGFWKLPINIPCSNLSTDAPGFILEANNGKKYNIVKSALCFDESSDFTKACQELLRYAKVNNKIQVDFSSKKK